MSTINPRWRKSSRSGDNGGTCVEVAALDRSVGVRDSKNPAGGHVTVSRAAWRSFTRGIKQR